MKEKIFIFIIGLLVGAILSAGVFLIINNVNSAQIDLQRGGRGEFDFGNMQQIPNMKSGKEDKNFENVNMPQPMNGQNSQSNQI